MERERTGDGQKRSLEVMRDGSVCDYMKDTAGMDRDTTKRILKKILVSGVEFVDRQIPVALESASILRNTCSMEPT